MSLRIQFNSASSSIHSKVKCHPLVKTALGLAGTWRDAIETIGNLQGIAPITENEVVHLLRCCSRLPGSLWSTQLVYFSAAQKLLTDEGMMSKTVRNSRGQDAPITFKMPPLVVEAMVGIALGLKQRKLARYVARTSGVEPSAENGQDGATHFNPSLSTDLMLLRLYAAEGKWKPSLNLWGSQFATKSGSVSTAVQDQALFYLMGALGRCGKWELASRLYVSESPSMGASSAVSALLCLAPHRWSESLCVAASHYATSNGVESFSPSPPSTPKAQGTPMPISHRIASNSWMASLRRRYENVEGRFLVALLRLSETELRSRQVGVTGEGSLAATENKASHTEGVWVTALGLYRTLGENPERRRFASTAALSLLYHQLIETVDEHSRHHSAVPIPAALPRGAPIRFTNPIVTFKRWEGLLYQLSADYASTFRVPMLMKSLPQLIAGVGLDGLSSGNAANVNLSGTHNSFRPRIVVADTNVVLQLLYSTSFEGQLREVIEEAMAGEGQVTIILPFTVVKEVVAHIRHKWKARAFGLPARKVMYKRFLALFQMRETVDGKPNSPSRSIRWVALSPLQDAPGLSFLALLPSAMFESPQDPDRFTLATVLYLEYLCNTVVGGEAKRDGGSGGEVAVGGRTGERVSGYSHRAFVNRFGSVYALDTELEKATAAVLRPTRKSLAVNRLGHHSVGKGNGPHHEAVRPHVLFLTRDRALFRRATAFGIEARNVSLKKATVGEAASNQDRRKPVSAGSFSEPSVHPIYQGVISRMGLSKHDVVR
jgi:hypothetical protein